MNTTKCIFHIENCTSATSYLYTNERSTRSWNRRGACVMRTLLLYALLLTGCDAVASVRGTVLDEDGSPIADAIVLVKSAADSDVDIRESQLCTDEDGKFHFHDTFSPYSRRRNLQLEFSKQEYETSRISVGVKYVGTTVLRKSPPPAKVE